jgi:hypothetical protein
MFHHLFLHAMLRHPNDFRSTLAQMVMSSTLWFLITFLAIMSSIACPGCKKPYVTG